MSTCSIESFWMAINKIVQQAFVYKHSMFQIMKLFEPIATWICMYFREYYFPYNPINNFSAVIGASKGRLAFGLNDFTALRKAK